ncbi:MAG: TatD family hydrolase [Candidatus Bathyarchaeia archaeon]
MRFIDAHIYLSEDEYGHARALSKGLIEVSRRMPLTNLLTETDGPVSFRGPFSCKMTTPSFILLAVEAIVQLKWKKETEVADQIFQSFTNFLK